MSTNPKKKLNIPKNTDVKNLTICTEESKNQKQSRYLKFKEDYLDLNNEDTKIEDTEHQQEYEPFPKHTTRKLSVTQFKLELKRFVKNVLDQQTMSKIDSFLKQIQRKDTSNPANKMKRIILHQDLETFKFLKDNQQKIDKVETRQLFKKLKISQNTSQYKPRYLQRIRRIFPSITKQKLFECIDKRENYKIEQENKSPKCFLKEKWDQHVEQLIKKYILKAKKQKVNKSLSSFTLLQDCIILLSMKENCQKSTKQISQIVSKQIKKTKNCYISARMLKLQTFLIKSKLMFCIENNVVFTNCNAGSLMQNKKFMQQIQPLLNSIQLEQILKRKQTSEIMNPKPSLFTQRDDLIICLYVQKYLECTSIKSIYSIVAKKIRKTQQQVRGRFKSIKRKHLKSQYLKEIVCNFKQNLHQDKSIEDPIVKQQTKTKTDFSQCLNNVKLQTDPFDSNFSNSEQKIWQNYNQFEQTSDLFQNQNMKINREQTTIGKLNQSQTYQSSFMLMLQQLQNSILNQSHYRQNMAKLESETKEEEETYESLNNQWEKILQEQPDKKTRKTQKAKSKKWKFEEQGTNLQIEIM